VAYRKIGGGSSTSKHLIVYVLAIACVVVIVMENEDWQLFLSL